MRISVVAAGKIKEKCTRELASDYAGRISARVRFDEIESRDDAGLKKAVPDPDVLVVLEVWGEQLKSEEFARKLEAWGTTGKGHVAFVIGAADGVPKDLSQMAHFHLSLSKMTLPHRLARVILFEQIYRGLSILRGEPYARED